MDHIPVQKAQAVRLRIPPGLKQGGEHGEHTAVKAVVKGHPFVHHPDPGHCGEKDQSPHQKTRAGGFRIRGSGPEPLKQINHGNGQGEGQQYVQIQISPHHQIGPLAQNTQQEDGEKILQPAAGVAAALGNHEGINGKGQPPDDPEDKDPWKQEHPSMVHGHGHGRKNFQHIAAEAPGFAV